jgi:hypothetical protein
LPIRVVAAEVSILCFYHCNYFINFYSTNLLSLALTITVKEASVAAPPREGDAVAHLNCCRGGEYFIFYHCNYFTSFYSTNLLSLAFHDGVTRMERTTGRGRWSGRGGRRNMKQKGKGPEGFGKVLTRGMAMRVNAPYSVTTRGKVMVL